MGWICLVKKSRAAGVIFSSVEVQEGGGGGGCWNKRER